MRHPANFRSPNTINTEILFSCHENKVYNILFYPLLFLLQQVHTNKMIEIKSQTLQFALIHLSAFPLSSRTCCAFELLQQQKSSFY